MTEIVHAQEAVVLEVQAAAPDVIDQLAGIALGDWLDQLRRARPQTREQAQKSHEALFG